MSKLILPRRRFLFTAPAIVAASSLMPGHSITAILTPPPPRDFYWVFPDPLSLAISGSGLERVFWGVRREGNYFGTPKQERLTQAEVETWLSKQQGRS